MLLRTFSRTFLKQGSSWRPFAVARSLDERTMYSSFFLRGCKPACTGDVCFQPLKCQLSLFVLLDNKLFTLKDDALVGIL